MKEEIQNKIDRLKSRYLDDDSRNFLHDIEGELQIAFEYKELASSPLFKAIHSEVEQNVKEINSILLLDRDITDIERKILIMKRDLYKFFMDKFGVEIYDEAINAYNELLEEKNLQ